MVEEDTLGADSHRELPDSHAVQLNQLLGDYCLSPEACFSKILPKLPETQDDQEEPFGHKALTQAMFSPNSQRLMPKDGRLR